MIETNLDRAISAHLEVSPLDWQARLRAALTAVGVDPDGTSEPTPKWITFDAPVPSRSGLTLIWTVRNGDVILGSVRWFGSWRKYAFFPEPEMVFEQDCLRDLANFCEQRTRDHKSR